LLDSLTPQQFDELVAFDRIEPDSPERLHAQLSAIGGGIFHELQTIRWLLSVRLLDREAMRDNPPPEPLGVEALDPLRPDARRRPSRNDASGRKRRAKPEDEFMSAGAAAAMVRNLR
jgi:hypothetical protein